MVDATLFDLDGTLVETNIDFTYMREQMVALAVEAGLTPSSLDGLDILAIVDEAMESLNTALRGDDAEALNDRAMAILEDIEIEHARNAEEVPFAKHLLRSLDENGIGVGIVTRNCRKASLIALDATDIRPNVLICREDTKRRKPHPDPLHAALALLKARSEASVMVGDHTMDIQSGKAAGLVTIGFLRDHRPDDFFFQVSPDLTVRTLEEVLCAIVDSNS